MTESKRIHFVRGDLQTELDRLDVTRTETCVECGEVVPDPEVAELEHREGDQYDTVCIWCEDSRFDTFEEDSS